jgi:hypothetical protein
MAGPKGALAQLASKTEAENDKHSPFLRLPAGEYFPFGSVA